MFNLKQINSQESLDDPNLDIEIRKKIFLELDSSNQKLFVYYFFLLYFSKFLKKNFEKGESVKILELGSGSGGLAREMLKRFSKEYKIDYYIYDLDPGILEWAQSNCRKKGFECKTILADKNKMGNFQKDEFDVIISLHTLHHVHPFSVLEELFTNAVLGARKGLFFVDFHRRFGHLFFVKILSFFSLFSSSLLLDGKKSLERAYSLEEFKKITDRFKLIFEFKLFFWNPYVIIQCSKHDQ